MIIYLGSKSWKIKSKMRLMDCQDNFGQVTLHSTGTKDDVNVLCYFLSKVKIDDVKEE